MRWVPNEAQHCRSEAHVVSVKDIILAILLAVAPAEKGPVKNWSR